MTAPDTTGSDTDNPYLTDTDTEFTPAEALSEETAQYRSRHAPPSS